MMDGKNEILEIIAYDEISRSVLQKLKLLGYPLQGYMVRRPSGHMWETLEISRSIPELPDGRPIREREYVRHSKIMYYPNPKASQNETFREHCALGQREIER